MSITINAANQITSPGSYIAQAYEKSREEARAARAKESDPEARADAVAEPVRERSTGMAVEAPKKAEEDAVVVDISNRRAEVMAPPPASEEEPTQVEAPEEEEKPKEEAKPNYIEA